MVVGRPRRLLGAVVLGAVAVGLLATALVIGAIVSVRRDGPLPITDAFSVTFGLDAGEAASWGIPLPGSAGLPVVLTGVQAVNIRGLDVLGYAICRSSPVPDASGDILHCAPVAEYGWPPSNFGTEPVVGVRLEAVSDPLVDLVIGVRRQPRSTDPAIGSVLISYRAGQVDYQVTEPWSLDLVASGVLPSGAPSSRSP